MLSSRSSLIGLLLLSFNLGGLSAGCTPAKGPDKVLKPLEERRARAIIEEAIRSGGMTPTPPQIITLLRADAQLSEDMRIGEGPYAVAYLTYDEEKKLSGIIPDRDPNAEELRLEKGKDGEIVLIVWAQNYRFDSGEEHTATAITAERKLRRDVSDFIQHVVKAGKGQ